MKVKTITCHDVGNVGASLQAYALCRYLNHSGCDAEIIDYKPGFKSKYDIFFRVNNPRFDKPFIRLAYCLAKLPERIKWLKNEKHKVFREFKQNYLPTTMLYNSIDALRAYPPKADVYFAGSDQIWNTMLPNGKDPAFYLDFGSEETIRASYAASFAVEDIDEDRKPQMARWLKNFDYISVREKSGLAILENLGIKNAVNVMDPVFLLSKEEWEKLDNYNTGSGYILVYDFDRSDKVKDAVTRLAEESGCKIYSIYDVDYADKCFSSKGPLAFISLVHNADYVVSNSFHATAFSIIFEKQFWVFNRREGINTRMQDLTSSLEIADRLIEDKDGIVTDSKIDYKRVYEKLNPMIEFSKNYIDKVLSAAKQNQAHSRGGN